MANWYEAPCLKVLLRQVNEQYKGRDRTSDGMIGDVSHQSRRSDHNPDWSAGGVVRARDFDKDGLDKYALVQALIRDDRVEYVIFEGLIYQRKYNFVPRKYAGVNSHHGHIHVSIRHGKKWENDTRPWNIGKNTAVAGNNSNLSEDDDMPTAAEVANAVLNTADPALGGNTLHQAIASLLRVPGDVNTVHEVALATRADVWTTADEARATRADVHTVATELRAAQATITALAGLLADGAGGTGLSTAQIVEASEQSIRNVLGSLNDKEASA